MNRYIVIGGWCEHMAHLQCLAVDENDALNKWEISFPDLKKEVFLPIAYRVDDNPLLNRHWRKDGDRFYSGSYSY